MEGGQPSRFVAILPVEMVISEARRGRGTVICMGQWSETALSKQALRHRLGPDSKQEANVE